MVSKAAIRSSETRSVDSPWSAESLKNSQLSQWSDSSGMRNYGLEGVVVRPVDEVGLESGQEEAL